MDTIRKANELAWSVSCVGISQALGYGRVWVYPKELEDYVSRSVFDYVLDYMERGDIESVAFEHAFDKAAFFIRENNIGVATWTVDKTLIVYGKLGESLALEFFIQEDDEDVDSFF